MLSLIRCIVVAYKCHFQCFLDTARTFGHMSRLISKT